MLVLLFIWKIKVYFILWRIEMVDIYIWHLVDNSWKMCWFVTLLFFQVLFCFVFRNAPISFLCLFNAPQGHLQVYGTCFLDFPSPWIKIVTRQSRTEYLAKKLRKIKIEVRPPSPPSTMLFLFSNLTCMLSHGGEPSGGLSRRSAPQPQMKK